MLFWSSKRMTYWAVAAGLCLSSLVGCGGGNDGGAPTVQLFPSSAQVAPGGTVQFRTVLENWTGGVTWSVDEADGGSISADGLYQAPDAAGLYTVIARSVVDGAVKNHAVVIVGDLPGDLDPGFDFSTSPVQPGVMKMTGETGCIRGKLLDHEQRLVTGVAMHLYRLTDAAGRAWESGRDVDLTLPARSAGSRQATGNGVEAHRATTVSTASGYYHEPTNNYTFGTTPAGYYAVTFELRLPDGRQGEVLGAVTRVVKGGDVVVNVFTDQSPTVNSAELQPGQTRPLAQPTIEHLIGKVSSTSAIGVFHAVAVDHIAGLGTFGAGVFTAGSVPGVFSIVSNRPDRFFSLLGVAPVHIVGVRARFEPGQVAFEGGPATLSVAAVDGLEGSTATPVPLKVSVTGPDGFSQGVAMSPASQSATSFNPTGFTFPDDWQFFTGVVNLPANVTNTAATYTAAVTATYGVAGAVNESASVTVQGVDQPAEPPAVRGR